MKKVLILAFFATLVYACSQSDSNKNTSEPTAAAPAVDGEKVYKTYCVTCHGLYGDMGASGAFNLQTSVLPVEERINVITNGYQIEISRWNQTTELFLSTSVIWRFIKGLLMTLDEASPVRSN